MLREEFLGVEESLSCSEVYSLPVWVCDEVGAVYGQ